MHAASRGRRALCAIRARVDWDAARPMWAFMNLAHGGQPLPPPRTCGLNCLSSPAAGAGLVCAGRVPSSTVLISQFPRILKTIDPRDTEHWMATHMFASRDQFLDNLRRLEELSIGAGCWTFESWFTWLLMSYPNRLTSGTESRERLHD
ncbi:hypothetical protein DFH09DRAFT_1369645, partial [Mycena vulgaris]